MTIIQRNSGTFNGTSFNVTPSLASFGTGTVLVVAVFANTIINTPSGWDQRTSSVVDMGLYTFDKAGAGETGITFTNSAGTGEWFVWELPAGSTWLTGQAAQTATSGGSYTSPAITPSAGDRYLLGVVGGNGGGNARDVSSFSDGFTEFSDLQVTTQDWTFSAAADVEVVADGSTAYSTTGTYSAAVGTRGGITLAYVNAGSGTSPVSSSLELQWQVKNVVASGIDLRWAVATVVSSPLDLRWSVRSVVTAALELSWLVRNVVSAPVDLPWALLATISAPVDLPWTQRSLVGSPLDLRWGIGTEVSGPIDLRWLIRIGAASSLSLLWLSEAAPLPTERTPTEIRAILTQHISTAATPLTIVYRR